MNMTFITTPSEVRKASGEEMYRCSPAGYIASDGGPPILSKAEWAKFIQNQFAGFDQQHTIPEKDLVQEQRVWEYFGGDPNVKGGFCADSEPNPPLENVEALLRKVSLSNPGADVFGAWCYKERSAKESHDGFVEIAPGILANKDRSEYVIL